MPETNTKTILIVDDDPGILEQLELFISRLNMTVIQACGQGEAEGLIAAGTKFDLAILDLMMEENDSGFILSHKIKQLYPDVPVILLTGVASEAGIQFGSLTETERSWIKADLVMDKDIRFEQLSKEINHLLRN